MNTKIEKGKTYIFNRKSHHVSAPFKGRVEDITLHTYLIKDLDSDKIIRHDKNDFEKVWRILE